MAGHSLFHTITRYVASPALDPGEDRLTEITAAVLERVDGLARHLALRWLDPRAEGSAEVASPSTERAYRVVADLPAGAAVSVRTQVVIAARRVDMELRFHGAGRTSPTAALLWVEVKHGITPHSGQLLDYVALRPKYPGAVVLVAPRPDLPAAPAESPPSVPQRSWQATAAAGAAFARDGGVVDRWLIEQWLAYLQEERLMELDALGPEHLTALAYGVEARAAMEVITQEASRVLEEARGAPIDDRRGRHGKPAYGIGYWGSWTAALPENGGDWDGAWLDWKVAESHGGGLDVPAGRVFVMAGLSRPNGSEFGSDPAWRERVIRAVTRGGESLTLRRWKGDHERLQRVAYPHEILRGSTLEEQGASLGRWVAETFAAIEAVGPPGIRD